MRVCVFVCVRVYVCVWARVRITVRAMGVRDFIGRVRVRAGKRGRVRVIGRKKKDGGRA